MINGRFEQLFVSAVPVFVVGIGIALPPSPAARWLPWKEQNEVVSGGPETRQDKDKTRPDKTRQGKGKGKDKTRQDKTRRRQDKTRQDKTR